jgi:hypothetical protein
MAVETVPVVDQLLGVARGALARRGERKLARRLVSGLLTANAGGAQ